MTKAGILQSGLILLATVCAVQGSAALKSWPDDHRQEQENYESALKDAVNSESLRRFHELIGTKPHFAGTANDLEAADRLAAEFEKLDLEVEKQELWVYLAKPIDAAVEVVTPSQESINLQEDAVAADKYSSHPELSIGWNAFSGSGEVTSQIVYANYGTKEDFETLQKLGVDVKGKIVIARYGRNYRGYKAKFATKAGAAGLIIYTDPKDSGYMRGIMYPEGGYANPSYIQRGSIKTLDYVGDPLTPFEPAVKNAKRLDPKNVALPTIPVQPISWRGAYKIMHHMRGDAVPSGWQGGLPFAYRLTGGEHLTVRLVVKQSRELTKVYNVLGTLRGAEQPDQKIYVGCHYDAWSFGAADPLAGTMVVCETARCFAELARKGLRPARSIVFAHWAAEEYGIIGSVEWVEANRHDLLANGVAYINLDMAAMGKNFGSSAAPILQSLIAESARSVPAIETSKPFTATVLDEWIQRSEDDALPGHPRFGHLGGGSDHVGFYCHTAVPSASLGAGGSKGVSYHSNYDSLDWYRKVVGDDYVSASMVTQVTNIVVSRLANAPLLPFDPVRYGPDIRRHLAALEDLAKLRHFELDLSSIEQASIDYERLATEVHARILNHYRNGKLTGDRLKRVNDRLLRLERKWYYEAGLPDEGGFGWYRNLYASTDPDSGYAAWMLPGFRYAIERSLPGAAQTALKRYKLVLRSLMDTMREIDASLAR